MRLSKIQVVAAALACLLVTGAAQGQFGKLKSLAQEKLGNKAKDDNPAKGPFGEAKATYAPGVKKSVDVSRKSGPSPEASITAADSGRSQVVTIKVTQLDARQFDAVRGYSPCNKLTNFQILSATQMKVTIDLTENKSGGTCSLYYRSGGNTVFTSTVTIRGKK